MDEKDPRPQFTRPHIPSFVLQVGRAVRKRRALGPRLGLYQPISTLVLPENVPSRSCLPSINFHTHLGRWLSTTDSWMEPDVARLVDMMDSSNQASLVNLDGRWGHELEENLDRYDRAHPNRFFTFCHVNWQLLQQRDGPDRLATSLERSVAAGARGLKVWKDLGMEVKVGGRRILPDDPMLGPLWETAGRLGVPVLIHTADPAAFFQPVDRRNERLEELARRPHMAAAMKGGVADFRRLIGSVEHIVASHPRTSFVAAHGYHPEDLAHVGGMLGRYSNFSVDIACAQLQLGRQPRMARDLVIRFADQVVYGTDVFPLREALFHIYFRFLETADESFSYTDEVTPRSGRWPIYGLDLPREVLEKVYRTNAKRLLGITAVAP